MVSPTQPPVTGEPGTPGPVVDAALTGPYDLPRNGHCAAGHPLNGEGRCNELNTGLEAQQGAPAVLS